MKQTDDYVVLRLWHESTEVGENGQTKPVWIKGELLSDETYINDISITTSLDKDIIAFGYEAHIQPLGVKLRECRISGSFKYNMPMEYMKKLGGPPIEIKDENLLRGIFEGGKSGTELYGKAISVEKGQKHVYELVNDSSQKPALWVINDFSWDRQAKELGKYRFSMTCGYVWHVGAPETQIYDRGVGSECPQNVHYIVNDKQVSNTRIQKSLIEINTMSYTTFEADSTKFPSENDEVIVYCSTEPTVPCFHGYIKEVKNNPNGSHNVSCIEIGNLLYDTLIANTDKGLFVPRVKLQNPLDGTYVTIQQATSGILKKFFKGDRRFTWTPGVGFDKTSYWGEKDYIPGNDEERKLPSLVFSGMSVGNAINTLIKETCNMNFWFERKNDLLQYGFINENIKLNSTNEFIQNSTKIKVSDSNLKPDYVLLYDNYGNYTAYGFPTETPISAVFRLTTDVPSESLDNIAKRLYDDMQLDRSQFKVVFPPGTVRFNEGDIFGEPRSLYGLGDQTVFPKMEFKSGFDADPLKDPGDSVWQIRDIILTDTYTEVVVGPSYRSIFDIFGDQLHRQDGAPAPSEVTTIMTNKITTKLNIDENGGN